METKTPKVIGWLLLLAWGAALGWLTPTPPTTIDDLRLSYYSKTEEVSKDGKTDSPSAISRSDIERFISFNTKRIWFEWMLKLSLLLAGIAGAIMTLLKRNHWAFVVISTSIIYLGVWIIRHATLAEPFIEAYLTYANGMMNSGVWSLLIQLFLYQLLLPLFHFLIVIYLFLYRATAGSPV